MLSRVVPALLACRNLARSNPAQTPRPLPGRTVDGGAARPPSARRHPPAGRAAAHRAKHGRGHPAHADCGPGGRQVRGCGEAAVGLAVERLFEPSAWHPATCAAQQHYVCTDSFPCAPLFMCGLQVGRGDRHFGAQHWRVGGLGSGAAPGSSRRPATSRCARQQQRPHLSARSC